ncbi:methylmalonyl-CoA mutase [Paraburkholderia xenovorans]|uniref:methylmalonyl-CoA mutase n=1 Tax=Paraburkholderia xenovorans TaxID=36873 RepID=UPI0038BA40C4
MTARKGLPKVSFTIELKPLYTASDISGIPHVKSLPGEAPFVRGVHASMYSGKPWTIRQYAGYADAVDSNLAFRRALVEGAQGLSVAFDLPTQRGYDSDDAGVHADVGMAGVAIDTVEDMVRLFEGIPLDRVSVSMTMNGAVLPVLAAYIVAAEESGVEVSGLTGTVQNDILKEYMVRNTYIFAPEESLRITSDVAQHLARVAPRFNALSVSGYHFHEAGADAVLELALTFANACKYVEILLANGMSADLACERISFFFGVGKQFFGETAKLRAARLIWSELAAQYGASTEKARGLRMHCQTSGFSLSAQQADNNVVRTTVEAMAAIFGGTQSLHTNAYDEALSLPSADASRLARDTQLILQHEMGLCDVVDPWAGSFMMESLTDQVARRVREKLSEIKEQGGVLEAIHSGWVQREIGVSATEVQAATDSGKRVVVGLNRFVSRDPDTAVSVPSMVIDNQHVRTQQVRRINSVKIHRDASAVTNSLRQLTEIARSRRGNLLQATIDCMRLRATVGECIKALEAVWPRYSAAMRISHGIYASARGRDSRWEGACDAVRELAAELGRAPGILLVKLGQDGHDRGIKLIGSALSDAGFRVVMGGLFGQACDAVDFACAEMCDVLGVSSLAGAHLGLVSDLFGEMERRNLTIPVVLGGIVPDEHARSLKRRGIEAVLGPGMSMEAIVASLVEVVRRRICERAASARGTHSAQTQSIDF